MNKVILMGRLTKDPVLQVTKNGISVAQFSIAVDRRFASKEDPVQADFFNITAWRKTGEFAAQYFTKGQRVAVVGSLQNRSYTDKQNVVRYVTDVIADEVYFADSKKEAPAHKPITQEDFSTIELPEDLPF